MTIPPPTPRSTVSNAVKGLDVVLVDVPTASQDTLPAVLAHLGVRLTRARSEAVTAILDARIPDVVVIHATPDPARALNLIEEIRWRPDARGGAVPLVAIVLGDEPSEYSVEHGEWRALLMAGVTRYVSEPVDALDLGFAIHSAAHLPPLARDDRLMPDLILPAGIVALGSKTSEGSLVEGVSVAWFELVRQLAVDPNFLTKVPWRTVEEVIAGAYEREGFEVVLTPRSRDKGRDVIASKRGIGAIRIIDQVKAYSRDRKVQPDDVRAIMGVLLREPNVSKAVVSTTSEFSPSILTEWRSYIPFRLELKSGRVLREWLTTIAKRRPY